MSRGCDVEASWFEHADAVVLLPVLVLFGGILAPASRIQSLEYPVQFFELAVVVVEAATELLNVLLFS